MNRKIIGKSVLGLYIILSLLYILWTFWNMFRINVIRNSFEQGRRATIGVLLAEVEAKGCTPIPVFTEEKSIEIVNASCLPKSTATETPKQ